MKCVLPLMPSSGSITTAASPPCAFTAAAQQRGIGGVHDGIDFKFRNIAFNYFKHCHDLLLNVGNLVVSSTKPNVSLPIFSDDL